MNVTRDDPSRFFVFPIKVEWRAARGCMPLLFQMILIFGAEL